jgi:hypothetical protein
MPLCSAQGKSKQALRVHFCKQALKRKIWR